MFRWIAVEKIPFLKTLAFCPKVSRKRARAELGWTMGFALTAIPVIFLIVLFTRPYDQILTILLNTVGRGELMIYAATACGAALYNLRHEIQGPIPDALRDKVTPVGTLSTTIVGLLFIALGSYLVRQMAELNKFDVHDTLLNVVALIVLILSLLIAYTVVSLKFALEGGSVPPTHEQDASFQKHWENRGA